MRRFCNWAIFVLDLSHGTKVGYVNSLKYNAVDRGGRCPILENKMGLERTTQFIEGN